MACRRWLIRAVQSTFAHTDSRTLVFLRELLHLFQIECCFNCCFKPVSNDKSFPANGLHLCFKLFHKTCPAELCTFVSDAGPSVVNHRDAFRRHSELTPQTVFPHSFHVSTIFPRYLPWGAKRRGSITKLLPQRLDCPEVHQLSKFRIDHLKRFIQLKWILVLLACWGCASPRHSSINLAGAERNRHSSGPSAEGNALFDLISSCVASVIAIGYEAQGRMPPQCKLFFDELEKLECGIETRLIFVKRFVLVKQHDQFVRTISDDPIGGSLFMTEPLPQLQGDSLLFVSSMSPISFAIVQISPNLECKLIYDNSCKPDLLKHADTTVDSVGKVEMAGEGIFQLREQKVRTMSRASLWPRTFELKVTADGKFELSEKRIPAGVN
jgi:hypothetical protein